YHGAFAGHPDQPVPAWKDHELGEVPEGHYTVPIGEAVVHRAGTEVTVVTYGTMVHVAATAAEESGIDAEVIDLRTLVPLDLDLVVESVERTGRCVVLHEATKTSGFGAELAALVQEAAFFHLEAPVRRVTGWDTPYPHAQEWDYFPGPDRVARAMRETLAI
ncbi:MAG: transketolase C-terminal domain-containing protein, partial [Acidimicrobiia bacterium]